MKKIKLIRQNEPDFKELYRMISEIENFLEEDSDIENAKWMENLNEILNFQDSDGSFKLLSPKRIPSDARVDFCHIPTYICTSILMKAYLTGNSALAGKVEKQLIQALEMSCARNLAGHGYDAFKGQIEALNIFIKGGLREFMDLYPDLNFKFTEMILNIKNQFETLEREEKFTGAWGESYKEEILEMNKYFQTRKVFVYGTLMKDESNHHYLENGTFLQGATLKGYDMYNVGYFPAIVPGSGKAIGELYEVPLSDMSSIDMLEGEGNLYIRKCGIAEYSGEKTLAYVYEYSQDVFGLEKINSWKEYVWYVSYGSNMLFERFLCYIRGGNHENTSDREPCRDTSNPVSVKAIEISYDMYFGNYSRSWDGCGVSFLDTTKEGKALGVAYLITKEQFDHVAAQENSGRFPDGTGSWYENIVKLGEMDGFELVTVTNNELRPYNAPCEGYLDTLKRGIRENWPEMSEEDIDDYLDSCIRE